MPYNEAVAERIRKLIERNPLFREQKMFGGIAFMLNGNMCLGVLDDNLVLRLGDEKAAAALKEPHTEPMTFTGKVMKSIVYVHPKGFSSDNDLKKWMQRAIDFALTLPPK